MRDLSHLPADIKAAIDDYDAMLADGRIVMGRQAAESYPGHDESDAALGEWLARHTAVISTLPSPTDA